MNEFDRVAIHECM